MDSQHEIPSAILVAALVAKSELKERELERYAVNLYRFLVQELSKSSEEKL